MNRDTRIAANVSYDKTLVTCAGVRVYTHGDDGKVALQMWSGKENSTAYLDEKKVDELIEALQQMKAACRSLVRR